MLFKRVKINCEKLIPFARFNILHCDNILFNCNYNTIMK